DGREASAENFVTLNNVGDCSFERSDIDRTEQAQGRCDMISRTARFELIDEPEALLGEGKGRGPGGRALGNRNGGRGRFERLPKSSFDKPPTRVSQDLARLNSDMTFDHKL